MSDFIYSKNFIEKKELTREIQKIYHQNYPSVKEFQGDWGSLAVSNNLYDGFQSYETTEHICIVLGGPILCYQIDNSEKDNSDSVWTQSIYYRWKEGSMIWDEDLSGHFVIFIVNKMTSESLTVTDLMSFIPVYAYHDSTNIMLSSHVDVLASVSRQKDNIDVVSKIDFILHGVVTFPYTVYESLYQVTPASEHFTTVDKLGLQSKAYWLPNEIFKYKSIEKAADDIREGMKSYVNSITSDTTNVAQFISGGEDSRALSGLLQNEKNREAFVFLDQMNREGKYAKKAAHAYEANFNIATRSKLHYLEIMNECADLVGDGSQYFHAHTFGFHKSCDLNSYDAVFGGLLSDALLKGSHIKKNRGSSRFPFIPQFKNEDYSASNPIKNNLFSESVLKILSERRRTHLEYIKNFRNESAEEWFELWPSSMNMNIANLSANRRLFKSYEPFTAKEVVKVSAAVPQKWKLNRRLFHKTVKPYLKPTKWLFHTDGRLPYFPWYFNMFVQFSMWIKYRIDLKMGLIKGNQGPWGEWSVVFKSSEWRIAKENYLSGFDIMSSGFNEKNPNALFEGKLNFIQCINLMQTLYSNHKIKG